MYRIFVSGFIDYLTLLLVISTVTQITADSLVGPVFVELNQAMSDSAVTAGSVIVFGYSWFPGPIRFHRPK